MRASRQTFETHRAAILHAAGRMFRDHGVDRVSLAEVSREAGLTHGAFYGHYPSKTALVEASCRESMRRAAETWRRRALDARASGNCGVDAIVMAYLSESHFDAPEHGCALGAIGQELTRGDAALRQALAEGVAALTAVLVEEVAVWRPGLDPASTERIAQGVLAVMAGGLVLSRSITDPVKSAAALLAARGAARAACLAD